MKDVLKRAQISFCQTTIQPELAISSPAVRRGRYYVGRFEGAQDAGGIFTKKELDTSKKTLLMGNRIYMTFLDGHS